MSALSDGFRRYSDELAAENARTLAEQEAKRQVLSALYKSLQAETILLAEHNLMPQIDGTNLTLRDGEQKFATISPSHTGDLFEISVGSDHKTISGNVESCIENIGYMIAKVLDERENRARESRIAARRRPSPGGDWA